MRVIVEHIGGARSGQRQEFEDPIVVRFGRHPSNDVQFDAYQDLDASARHAELRREGAGFVLVDVGSSNGTLIGGDRVTHRLLQGGEEVQFGSGGPRVRIGLEGLDVPKTTPAQAGMRADAAPPVAPVPAPPPAGVRTTVFRSAVEAAVRQATRPMRALVLVLCLLALAAGAGLLLYRARGEAREEALRRKMVELMEKQRSADETERANIAKLIEQKNSELRKSSSGGAIGRAARGGIYLVAIKLPSAEEGFCTAFAIQPQVLVTNAHCVAAAEEYETRGGKIFVVRNGDPKSRFSVRAVKKHPSWRPTLREVTPDVGLLRIEGTAPELLTLAAPDELRRLAPGDVLYLYGFPGRLADTRSPEATFVQGVIGRLTRLSGEAAGFEEAKLIQHSAFTSGGTSGSPLLDGEGHVVAVNAGGYVEQGTMQVLDPQSGRAGEVVVSKNLAGYNFGMRIDLVRDLLALVE
ncbi:MAG TPA: trypsin-like peptidase domain-containing protein [Polyangia bacterium]|nr:trypsin-like peptidase domain-containing protein [Polyangia bacterium]